MVVIEHAGAEFVHHFGALAFLIDLDGLVVGISGLGVFVETLYVGVRGIAFTVGQSIAIVVLPDGAPLALAEVGTPFFPRNIFVGYSCRRIFSTGTPGVATADLGLWAAGTLLL